MQKYVTPAVGRWTPPKGNITNRDDYKLDITVKEFRQNQYVITIEKFIPEHGWIAQQFFVDPEELAKIQDILSINKG
jgi:hypothetical protein